MAEFSLLLFLFPSLSGIRSPALLSPAQPLANQPLLTSKRINGNNVYTTSSQEILRISITVPCLDCRTEKSGFEEYKDNLYTELSNLPTVTGSDNNYNSLKTRMGIPRMFPKLIHYPVQNIKR